MKAGSNGQFKMAGTGSKQEDQIITVALEKAVGKKLTYVPFKGGGDVAVQLVGKHVDSTVNNPIEAIAHWRSGALRALCVFDTKPMPYPAKVTATQSWQDVPTCKSQGLDVEYVMLRGIFMPAGVTPGRRSISTSTCSRRSVRCPSGRSTPRTRRSTTRSWPARSTSTGCRRPRSRHRELMQEAGFLAK